MIAINLLSSKNVAKPRAGNKHYVRHTRDQIISNTIKNMDLSRPLESIIRQIADNYSGILLFRGNEIYHRGEIGPLIIYKEKEYKTIYVKSPQNCFWDEIYKYYSTILCVRTIRAWCDYNGYGYRTNYQSRESYD